MKKYFSVITICFVILINIYSQSINLSYSGNNNYILTERTDLRRYDNDKYVGLLSREVRSFICPSVQNKDLFYEGFFYIQQENLIKMDLKLSLHLNGMQK